MLLGQLRSVRDRPRLAARLVHSFPEHPLKGTVTSLLHQRPFQRVELPSLVSSITLMPSRWRSTERGCDPGVLQQPLSESRPPLGAELYPSTRDQYDADYNALRELCDFFSAMPPAHGSTFFTTDLGGACKLRWERHTESQTYTFTRPMSSSEREQPFAESAVAMSVVPKRWLAALPGPVLAALHVAMLPSDVQTAQYEFAQITRHFHRDGLVLGCTVDNGRFRVYSDWRTHGDGFGRVIVHGMPDDTPNKRTAAGKALQRIVELDKYRALALLALPFAQKLTPRVDALSEELMSLTEAMRSGGAAG